MLTVKKIISPVVISIMFITVLIAPVSSFAQGSADEVCEGVKIVGGDCQTPGDKGKVDSLISDIVDVLSVVVGVVATIMIMVGGFKYVTSNGDSNQVSSAKNTILYAIIGIVIVVFAQVIVKFVINKA